jgi:predicted nucleic acid-binding protein
LILVDSSGLIAAADREHPAQPVAAGLLAGATERLLSPFVLAELDYLLPRRVDRKARDALLTEVALGRYRLEPFAASDIAAAMRVIEKFEDLTISLADASVCVLAERHGVADLLTLDQHFRVLPGPGGRPFRILPADLPRA